MPGHGEVFAPYRALLEKIDRRVAHGDPCPCPPGCDRCCRVPFTLLPVEAFHLREAFSRLPASRAVRVVRRALAVPSRSCPFLLDGGCAVYRSRPVLCRLHGHPFLRRGEAGNALEIHPGCECLPLEAWALRGDGGARSVPVQDLDGVNTLLVLVNDHFCRCARLGASGPEGRIPVSEIPVPRWRGGGHHADP